MPLSETFWTAVVGFGSTLIVAAIGWVASFWLQKQQREWHQEDERRSRRADHLNKEFAVIREYVDDLTTVLEDEWEAGPGWLSIEPPAKATAYEEGLKKRKVEFEEKWSGLERSPWPHVRAVNDRELHRLVGKLHNMYWRGLRWACLENLSKAEDDLFDTISAVYRRLDELSLD